MKEKMNKKRIIVVLALVLLLLVTATYAWMRLSKSSEVVNKITAGSLDLILDESTTNGILLQNQDPMSLQQGLKTQAYTFKIKNNSSINADYTINLVDDYEGVTIPTEGKLADSKIRYAIEQDGNLNEITLDTVVMEFIPESSDTVTVTATYDPTENKFVKVYDEVQKKSDEEKMNSLNNYIRDYSYTDANGALKAFKSVIGNWNSSHTYRIKDSKKRETHLLSEGRNILTGTAYGNEETEFTLHVWIDSQAGLETNGQIFSAKLNITADSSSNQKKRVKNNNIIGAYKYLSLDTNMPAECININAGTTMNGSIQTGESTYSLKYVAKYSDTDNMFISVEDAQGSSDMSSLKKALNSNIATQGTTDADGAYQIFQSTIGSTGVQYELIKGTDEISTDSSVCTPTTCYESGVCSAGTLIKYKVNDNTVKKFYVLHDDGKKITMIQDENTSPGNITWCNTTSGSANNKSGPRNALGALEYYTNGWTNVNNITYTAGTTKLGDSKYTGCTSDLVCLSNKYTMEERTARARLITVQEAMEAGCKTSSGSCPGWLVDNLYYKNDKYIYDGSNKNVMAYWTMNAYSDYDSYAWVIKNDYNSTAGKLEYTTENYDSYSGVRAVVEISKKIEVER